MILTQMRIMGLAKEASLLHLDVWLLYPGLNLWTNKVFPFTKSRTIGMQEITDKTWKQAEKTICAFINTFCDSFMGKTVILNIQVIN